jgi:hypothetical protein
MRCRSSCHQLYADDARVQDTRLLLLVIASSRLHLACRDYVLALFMLVPSALGQKHRRKLGRIFVCALARQAVKPTWLP